MGGIINAGGGGTTTNFAASETPAGTINGVNATFTLAHAPNPTSSVELNKNRLTLIQGTDYTVSGTTLTFLAGSIPQIGDIIVIAYRF